MMAALLFPLLFLPVLTSIAEETTTEHLTIAFVSERAGNLELYLINSDGSHLRRLTHNAANDLWPAWSPDGKEIAFVSDREGNLEIYVIAADGSNVKNLSANPSDDAFPTWSPNGRRIAFASKRAGISEIYIMDADGSHVKRVTHNGIDASDLAWSPDGESIAFVSDKTGNSEIYKMSVDGLFMDNLTDNGMGNWDPAWSPDGRNIVFVSDKHGDLEIYVMDADGLNERRLTQDPAVDVTPYWSPDGERIIFSSTRSGRFEIYTMDTDGSKVKKLTSGGGKNPAWAWVDGVMINTTTDAQNIQELIQQLADETVATNKAGDELFFTIGALPHLLDALSHPDVRVRRKSAILIEGILTFNPQAMVEIKSAPDRTVTMVQTLIEVLDDPDPEVRDAVSHAIASASFLATLATVEVFKEVVFWTVHKDITPLLSGSAIAGSAKG